MKHRCRSANCLNLLCRGKYSALMLFSILCLAVLYICPVRAEQEEQEYEDLSSAKEHTTTVTGTVKAPEDEPEKDDSPGNDKAAVDEQARTGDKALSEILIFLMVISGAYVFVAGKFDKKVVKKE